jgi:hypothetical protein
MPLDLALFHFVAMTLVILLLGQEEHDRPRIHPHLWRWS